MRHVVRPVFDVPSIVAVKGVGRDVISFVDNLTARTHMVCRKHVMYVQLCDKLCSVSMHVFATGSCSKGIIKRSLQGMSMQLESEHAQTNRSAVIQFFATLDEACPKPIDYRTISTAPCAESKRCILHR